LSPLLSLVVVFLCFGDKLQVDVTLALVVMVVVAVVATLVIKAADVQATANLLVISIPIKVVLGFVSL
jgi:hypothetical protein